METSASFEAWSAPSPYPTGNAAGTVLCGGRSAMIVPTATIRSRAWVSSCIYATAIALPLANPRLVDDAKKVV